MPGDDGVIADGAVSPDRTPMEAELCRSLRAIVARCEIRMKALREQGEIESTEADVLEDIIVIVARTPLVYPA